MPALNEAFLRSHISNWPDAVTVASSGSDGTPDRIEPLAPTMEYFNYKVTGLSETQKTYICKLRKADLESPDLNVRRACGCKCAGFRVALEGVVRDGVERACYHLGGVLIRCMAVHNTLPRIQNIVMAQEGPGWNGIPLYATQNVSVPSRPLPLANYDIFAKADAERARVLSLEPVAAASADTLSRQAWPTDSFLQSERAVSLRYPGAEPSSSAGNNDVHDDGRCLSSSNAFTGYNGIAEHATDILHSGGGQLLGLMNSVQTHAMANHLLGRVTNRDKVTLGAFTFGNAPLCASLRQAAHRGAEVIVYVDTAHTMTGNTIHQPAQLKWLADAGVQVTMLSGRTSGGIQHSKFLWINELLLVGSCNWTSGSASNHELSVLLSLNSWGQAEMIQHVVNMRQRGVRQYTAQDFKEAEAARRHRTSSVPAAERQFRARSSASPREQSGMTMLEDRRPMPLDARARGSSALQSFTMHELAHDPSTARRYSIARGVQS